MTAADAIVPTLRVCNCAGGIISETRLDTAAQAPGTASERGRLVTMGWTDGEMLVVVRERGGVEVRDIMVSAWYHGPASVEPSVAIVVSVERGCVSAWGQGNAAVCDSLPVECGILKAWEVLVCCRGYGVNWWCYGLGGAATQGEEE